MFQPRDASGAKSLRQQGIAVRAILATREGSATSAQLKTAMNISIALRPPLIRCFHFHFFFHSI
jgi:hypothetical protein